MSYSVGNREPLRPQGELSGYTALGVLMKRSYGIHVSIFSAIVYLLLCKPVAGEVAWPSLVYSLLLFACGTVSAASGIRFGETAWLGNVASCKTDGLARSMSRSSMETMGNVAFVAAILLGMRLIVQNTVHYNSSLDVSSSETIMVVSLCFLHRSLPHLSPQTSLTGVRQSSSTFLKSHTTLYTTLSAMLIESAALYVVIGIIHVVLFSRESSFHNLILGVMAQVECIAPDLIILRVAVGRAGSLKTPPPTISADLKFAEVSRCSPSLHPKMDISSTAETSADLTVQDSNAGSNYCHPV
ncbi:hypothetical protein BU17DRAFT_84944 [Hysterangium stoloniferum]|nr:hypothetical protein BU17DRAFT_84944 [Hysterangium stoloniferum]